MKQLYILAILCLFVGNSIATAQINLNTCDLYTVDEDFILTLESTDATGRNIYQTNPITGDQPCSGFGVCEFRIAWNTSLNRWEIIADDGDGDFTTSFVLYFNTSASLPNPPDLTLGTWEENTGVTGGDCMSIETLNGDVQASLSSNNAPTIAGTTAGQTVNDNATINLFSGITIADADVDNVATTISLDNNSKGVITGDVSGTGPYSITSRGPAAMQTALRTLSFNPTDNRTATSETTTFTVTINDGTDNTIDNTTTVISNAVAPTVSSVSVPSNGTYIANQNFDFTVNFNEAVTVNTGGGTPELSLCIGFTTRQATFLGGSGTANLQFRYIIQSGDLDLDGITVGALSNSGATLRDSGGKDANLTLNAVGPTSAVLVDAVAPRILNVIRQNPTTSPTSADALVWDVTFNEAVSNTSIADFTVIGTTATIASVTNLSGTIYRITLSGGDLAGLNGTVTLGIFGSQDISDIAGNALTNTTPTGTNNNTYVVENKIPLTITGITGDNKEYNGTTAATASGTASLSGVVGADDVSLGGTPVFAFGSADVGTGIVISTTGYTLSGTDAGNYTLIQPTLSADITSKAVTVTGITGDNKEYDGTTVATASGTASLNGVLGADDVSLSGTPVFTFANAGVGAGIVINTTVYTIIGTDAGNYTLTQPTLSADITTKAVTFIGLTGDNKEYDGTTAATVSGTALLSGVVGADDVSLSGTPVFTFGSADVGTGIAITTTGYTFSGADAGNYTLTQPTLSAAITSKAVTVTGITGNNKEYDGTTVATASGTASLNAMLGADDVSLSGTPIFTFASAGVGAGIAITSTGYALTGADAGNYTLTQPMLSAEITSKAVTVTGITGDNKEYDGTTAATASGAASLSGVAGTDVVSLGGTPVFAFGSADVGTGIVISTTRYTLSGTDAGNYTLTQPTLSADITSKAVTVTGITGDNKEYDGTTAATVSGTASLSGVVGADDVSFSGTPVFTFASADVGTGIAITTTGYTISGADAGNYTLIQPTLSADITSKSVTVTGLTGDTKEYDGTIAATAAGTASLSGVAGTDVVSLGGTPVFAFSSADVGTGIVISTTGYTLTGSDAGNYTLIQPTLFADITTKAVTVIGLTGDNKEYDGTIAATAAGTASLSGVAGTDIVSLGGTPVFTFGSCDIGTGIAITTTGYTLSGADAGNYTLTQPMLSADITSKSVTVTGLTGDNKEYDGTIVATASGAASLSGVAGTDVVSLGGTPVFSFGSADVGTGIVISTTGYTLSGTDAGNYTLIQPTLSADITTKVVTVTGLTGDNKEYDGTIAATAAGTASLSGVAGTDIVSLGGTPVLTFGSADVGTGIVISTTGYTLAGTDAGNYTLIQPTLSADITTKALTVTGITGDSKEYDGTIAATASGTASLSGVLGADDVSLSGTPVFTFANVDVGTGIAITTTGYTLSGTDTRNYILTQPGLLGDINPLIVVVEADAQTKVYGSADPSLTYRVTSGSLIGSDAFSGSLTRISGETVGTYEIIQGSLGLNSNYNLSYTSKDLTISKATITITADDQTKVYGAADPALTVGYSGFVNGESETDLGGTLNVIRATGETVGSYVISASGASSTNYDITYIDGNFEITPVTLTITADDQTKVYGAADPALTVSYSGFVNGDSETDLGGTLNISRTTGETVGSYVIIASGATSTNYDITFIDGNFEITPVTLTITADDQTKVYGAADPALTVSYSGFVNGDSETDLGGTLNISRTTGETVGSYVIIASGATSTNYDITFIDGNFEITPVTLTITADDQTKVYGAADPALTVRFSGFINGDSESDLGGTLNISRATGESVGSYVISASGLTSMNYDITYIDGSLAITPASLTITADDQTKIYGETDPTITVSYSGFVNGDSETDLDGSLTTRRTSGEAVGNYVISASGATSTNYDITYITGSFEITPTSLTITADDQTKVYGAADPALTVSYSGFVNGDSELDLGGTLSVTRTTGEAVGSYVITASGLTAMNYDITFIDGNFEITPASLTITADDQTKVYGAADPALTVSYSGFVNGDSESDLGGTLNISRTTGETVGSYVISASGATSTNYDITYITGSFEITPAALAITAIDQNKVYGTVDPALMVRYSGFENGESETDLGGTLSVTRATGESVGIYVISASGLTSMNYDITYFDGIFEITHASQTITFNPLPVLNLESDADFQLLAEASSGLPVTYTYTYISDVPAAMVSADGFVNLVQWGSIIITASQSGNENYSPAESVSQELEITSSNASIRSLFIGDQEYTNPDSQIVYIVDCDETAQDLVVSYETEENANSDFPRSFTVDISKPGIYRYAITITSQDGSTSKNYSIEIHKRFLFEDIIVQKFNNTLLVNNNPATNGGYSFVAFTWYKNGNVVGDLQYFSEGDEASDRLDPLAAYRVELTTEDGDVLSTCTFTVELDISSKIQLAPNPVRANASTTLFANFEKEELSNMKISILSLNGTLIDTFYTSLSKSSIKMPANIQAGMYLLVCETSKQTQTIQFIVH